MIKASAGGGGRGLRVVRSNEELRENMEVAAREAQASLETAASSSKNMSSARITLSSKFWEIVMATSFISENETVRSSDDTRS